MPVFKRPHFLASIFLLFVLFSSAFAATTPVSNEDRKVLEQQLSELEKQINQTEELVTGFKEKGKTLNKEIGGLDKEITKTNLQIKAIDLTINKINQEVRENEGKISATEIQLNNKKEALSSTLNALYDQESTSLIEILISSHSLSSFFDNLNSLESLQSNLGEVLDDVEKARDELVDQKQDLAIKKTDQGNLRQFRDQSKKELEENKLEKKDLLAITKGKESAYQEIVTISKKTAAQIRNRIFEFLGGGQLSFEDAYKLAKQAGDLTGMQPAMILAVLDRESSFGQNVGRCKYQGAMHPKRDIPIFLTITKALGLDPDTMLVSCANKDGAYGGAMGPTQFIPSTWQLYSDEIGSLTGNIPPSPWRNLDASVGTGLYLTDSFNSSACINYSKQIPGEALLLRNRCTAAKYYAGSRWMTYRLTYGEKVARKAQEFEDDIKSITAANN